MRVMSRKQREGSGGGILGQLRALGGLTFYKDFTNTTSLNADYSVGSGVGTFTATDSTPNYDSSGLAFTTTNDEVLTYETSGNRTKEAETIFVQFTPITSFTADGVARYLITTDGTTAEERYFRKSTSSALPSFLPRNSGVANFDFSPSINQEIILTAVAAGTTESTNALTYINGHIGGSNSTTDYSQNNWGTNFYIGSSNTGDSQGNVKIKRIIIFGRKFSNSEVSSVVYFLNSGSQVRTSPTNFYIKSGGDDTKDGLSDDNAWGTIDRVSNNVFIPGDTISFKNGSVFRTGNPLFVRHSGNSSNWITYNTYGTGDAPEIKNSGLIGTSWASESGEVYKTTLDFYTYGTVYSAWENEDTAYILKSSVANMTSRGTFYYDTTNRILYVRATDGADPTGKTIELSFGQQSKGMVIQASYIIVDGLKFLHGDNSSSSGIDVFDTTNRTLSNVTIKNCEIGPSHVEANGRAIYSYASNLTIQDTYIHDVWRHGYTYSSCGGTAVQSDSWAGYQTTGVLLQRNHIENCYIGFLIKNNCSGTIIRNNIVERMHVNGIAMDDIDSPSNVTSVYNNTVIHSPNTTSGHALVVQLSDGGLIAYNNILYSDFTGTPTNVQLIHLDSSYTNITLNNNLYFLAAGATCPVAEISDTAYSTLADFQTALALTAWGGKEANAVGSDPLFVGAVDFHIQVGSPAIGTGVDLSSYFTDDYAGSTRTVPFDIGAYKA